MGTGGKARPGRDSDHSPQGAEVNNEELYSSPPWRLYGVAGQLCFLLQRKIERFNIKGKLEFNRRQILMKPSFYKYAFSVSKLL
jgi:hypothetical protein